MVNIEKDVSPVFVSGTTNLTTANTSVALITRDDLFPKKGIQLKAGVSNVGSIFIGGINVNGTVTDPNCGLELAAGDTLFLQCEDPRVVWAFNATANDVCHWIVM